MAGLGNTGINGFLSSAKLTGQKIIKRGKEIPEMVENFLSGFAGYGWKIWEHKRGKYKLEIDDLNIRGTMTVYELLIQKIRAVIGALAITQGQGKIKSVSLSPDQSEYLIQVEEDMSFREYDFIRCQTWTGNVKMYHVKIDRISDNAIIHIPIEEFDTDYDEFGQLVVHNAPAIGDDIIQFGNEVYEDRQSAIYLHADESGQPAIDIMFGINSKDWTNCVKGRLGGDIPGGDGAKGMYFENGMIKGTDETGHTVYCIYPNGDAMFGDGSAMFNSDRSGQLAGGAIQWHFNDDKGRFELMLGEDVIMSWDNLDNTTKEMLTPKIGEDGNWWIGGKDTGQKAEGEDGASPYIGENGNWWLGTTDTGVRAKANDGKSPYIGTNGNWFIWDATQNKFVDSGDTSVGDDGKSPEIRDGYWWTWNGTEYINTGVKAKGDDGKSPYIGANGNWWVWDGANFVDSGDKAKGDDGKSPEIRDGYWWAWNGTEWYNTGVKAKGEDANLLDWVNEWNNNKTLIGAEYIVSPKTFSGTRGTDGKLTGVAMGRDCIEIDGVKRTGIFALVDDGLVFELDPISKKYKFTGEIQATSGDIGGFIIEDDKLRSQNNSTLTLNGKNGSIQAYNGIIGGFEIGQDRIGSPSYVWDSEKEEWRPAEPGEQTEEQPFGSLAIYKDFFKVGGDNGYVMFGDDVIPASAGGAFSAAGRIVNHTDNSGDPYIDNANYGLFIDVQGGDRNYGLSSNAALLAPCFVGTATQFINFRGTGYSLNFSQANVFLSNSAKGATVTLPNKSQVARMFGMRELPSSGFGFTFTVVGVPRSSKVTFLDIFNNDGVLKNYEISGGDVMKVLCYTISGNMYYQVLNYRV